MLFNVYCLPIGDIFAKHNVRDHIYADDTQLHVECPPNDHTDASRQITECVEDPRRWLTDNILLLNEDKTEAILPFVLSGYIHHQHRWVYHHHSSSLGSRCVPWLGEGLSRSSPNDPVLCCPLPYHVAPVFVQVVSPPLGWSPLTYFLVIWSPSGDSRGPSVLFEAVVMPCPGPFHFSHSVDYIYEFCPLPNPDVGPSIYIF